MINFNPQFGKMFLLECFLVLIAIISTSLVLTDVMQKQVDDDSLECQADEYYDAVLQSCVECSVVCKKSIQFCCNNCPEFCINNHLDDDTIIRQPSINPPQHPHGLSTAKTFISDDVSSTGVGSLLVVVLSLCVVGLIVMLISTGLCVTVRIIRQKCNRDRQATGKEDLLVRKESELQLNQNCNENRRPPTRILYLDQIPDCKNENSTKTFVDEEGKKNIFQYQHVLKKDLELLPSEKL